MKNTAKTPGWIQRRISGFTLTELLVAMTLSLFIIGGALSVFLSSQETYRTKADLEASQEAIRFAAYTISRTIRSGERIAAGSDDSCIGIILRVGADVPNCLGKGQKAEAQFQTNIFYSNSEGALICDAYQGEVDEIECDNEAEGEAIVLGLSKSQEAFSVLYGKVDDPTDWIQDKDYVARDKIDDMLSVRSVRIGLKTSAGGVSFVATLRDKVILSLGSG